VIKHLFLTVLGMSSMYVSAEETGTSQNNHTYSPLIEENHDEVEEDADRLFQLGWNAYHANTSSPKLKEQNFRNAREFLQKAADKGQPNALGLLGRMWERGEGGNKDLKQAENLYLMAHRAGFIPATNHLADIYRKTNQTEKYFNLTLTLASHGNPRAQIAMGNIYLEGSNKDYKITPNFKTAIEWYKKAADQGNLLGDFYLGKIYYFLKEYGNAYHFLVKVCQNDQAEKLIGKDLLSYAKFTLANLHVKTGHGTTEEAIKLYKEAIALGSEEAKAPLKKLISSQGNKR
jgi:TPR repeat protein